MMMILGIGYVIMLMYLLVILIALVGGCMLLLCYRDSLAEVNQLFDSPIIEKIPYIEALKGLKKKSFSKVRKEHRTMDQCAICLGDYTEKDEVAELKCDQRHYFHAACLEDWLKRKPECPLCKKPVVND
jgi:hypothetical protein